MVTQQTQTYTPDFSDLNVQFNQARGEGFGAERMTGKYMYWKKPEQGVSDPGYIVVGSATPQELVRQLDKGYIPLRHFGEFQLWNPQENWRVSGEPYRRIFQRPGGLMVFPVAQIVEHQWHLVPPYAGIVFPQLQGVELTDIRCVECRRWFTSQEMLMKHRSVRHAQTANNTALGESIATSVAKMNAPIIDRLTAVDPGQAALTAALQQQAAALTRIAERMALSQDETARLYSLLQERVNYGGHQGVPPAPPEPEAATDQGDDAQPLDASAIPVTDPPPSTTDGSAAAPRGRRSAPTPEGE